MADKKSQGRKNAKDLADKKTKPSGIGAKARAMASKLAGKGTGKRSGPVTDKPGGKPGKHAKFTGGKHAKSDYTAAKKNASGSLDAPAKGKHTKEAIASKPALEKNSSAKAHYEAKTLRKNLRKAS